jgi:hypothetical protein
MNTLRMQMSRHPLNYFRLTSTLQKKKILFYRVVNYYATTIDIDTITNDLLERYRNKQRYNVLDLNAFSIRCFTDRTAAIKDVSNLNLEEINKYVLELISKNRDSHIEQILLDCYKIRKFIGDITLSKLFRHYSNTGKPDMIFNIQKYCLKIDSNFYRKNGEFAHYLAKAECLRGNSEKGLMILKQSYTNNEFLRSLYRIILRELIQDAVLNRSEASLVIFKKYVIEYSEVWNDHYPLICLWHICWSSNWFSDQMLAEELFDNCETLRDIVRDK